MMALQMKGEGVLDLTSRMLEGMMQGGGIRRAKCPLSYQRTVVTTPNVMCESANMARILHRG